ncbi:hypothetical protein AAC387_Pa01g1974 [Persea americana]
MEFPRMLCKSQVTIITLSVVILLYLFFETLDLKSHLPIFTFPNYPSLSACARPPPLRVYMYDLDRRFNFGMMNAGISGGGPPSEVPPFPERSGIKRQHSMEYWMMASLVYGAGGVEGMEAVRVSVPEEADVFFVPFFSSLSVNIHGRNMTDPATEEDRKLQFDILEFLRNSKYYQRSGGRDHVIPMQHPNAFRFYRDQVNASILIVVDFGRYPRSLSSLSKDVVTPYVHVVDSFLDDDPADPFESRTTLLFFRGGTIRKAGGVVRLQLAKILTGKEGVHFEHSTASGEGIRASTEGMRSSKFCLHPAGDTPSSCRLFDAIASHCVPVIVSDYIELPFEDQIDYRSFSLFFSVEEALRPDYLLGQLRQIKKERWLEKWNALKNVAHHFEFQYPPKKDDAINMLWRQVRNKLPAIRRAMHRDRRLKVSDWWRRR